ncbi:MAG TPA: alcohol dehydrogenase catalytic domain-containing protein [Coriobacteriia bacterium]|nr:alcohol dehydrogenase catalytic domain-containing protein [Coriobacteriia bacterium]
MKAALLTELDHIEITQVPTPLVDANSALVRVRACAICGSDIRILHHGNPRVRLPQILGHEATGEVVSVGENVTRVRVGDRVALGADVPCGECSFCEDGMGTNCQINYAMGYQFAGSFAEYVLLNKTVIDHGPVHRIPEGVTFAEAALAEPLACVLNALERTPVHLGDTVVIIGAGPIGCMMIPVVKMMGAAKVIVVQRSKGRIPVALQFGADVAVCSAEEDAIARVKEETDGLGAHLVVTANPSASTQADALAMARNRGQVNLFGGLPAGSRVELDTNVIHYKELLVSGAHGSLPTHHRRALELIGSGRINTGDFISHRFGLDEIDKAFAAAEGHAGLRVVVEPWGPSDE